MPDSELSRAETMPGHAAWVAPLALAVGFALYNLVLAPVHAGVSSRWKWLQMLAYGVVFVQPLLLAAWTALGPGTLIYRFPISAATLMVWVFAHSFADFNLFARDGAESRLNVQMAFAFVVIFVVAAAVIGVGRRASGIHFSRSAEPRAEAHRGRNQFGTKYLLGWMTVCALLIVVGRSMSQDYWFGYGGWTGQLGKMVCAVAFFLLLTMPPTVVPLVALTRPTPWRWLMAICLAWPLSLWAAIEIVQWISPRPGGPELWECGMLQVGATAAALVSAIVLRLAGYRLTSRSDSAPPIEPAHASG